MDKEYFDTESTGQNDIFIENEKKLEKQEDEETPKDFDISTDKYDKIEIKKHQKPIEVVYIHRFIQF